ncbi:PREDICTED: uncharacterized protein LOC106748742 [Dinoponera quadriceps]|uniref:Uncharacterized protein LOC106748742 n=1 Tax=Dinoponera quadriceps TaxID=609295 RepID=A0A6P3XYR1_DINQU|nr:PREDICTED: uncharacterized protein LOC106748742 [Dinoponera quadriceps]XP_014483068.1 PREDICTED: uncharacterized protein LOC106748742 [Dinoponera quadriceps]
MMDAQVPAKGKSSDISSSEIYDSHSYQMTIVKEEIQLIDSPFSLNDDTCQATEQTEKESLDFPQEKIGVGRFDWPHEAVWTLLDAYKKLKHLLRNKKKAKFWTIVASHLLKKGYDITAFRCKKKITKLKNTYENIKKRSAQNGNSNQTWKYFEIMDELFKKESYIIPVVTLDSSNPNISFPEYNVDSDKSFDPYKTEPPVKRLKQIGRDNWKSIEKIIAIMEKKAILRKKMHEESMARQDKLLEILEKTEELFTKRKRKKSNECTKTHKTIADRDESLNIEEEILGK